MLKASVLLYPIPVMKIMERPSFLFGDSFNRSTPEIGRIRMNTSETSVHAAKGTESLMPIAFEL